MDVCLKHQSYRLCPHPTPPSCRLLRSKAREISAGSDPLFMEPRTGLCPLVLGPKETVMDIKYLGVYWGLLTSRSTPIIGRGPLPCFPKQKEHSWYHGTSQYWANRIPLEPMNWTPDHIHRGPLHTAFDPPVGPCSWCPQMFQSLINSWLRLIILNLLSVLSLSWKARTLFFPHSAPMREAIHDSRCTQRKSPAILNNSGLVSLSRKRECG